MKGKNHMAKHKKRQPSRFASGQEKTTDLPMKKAITKEIATTTKDIDIFGGWNKKLENPDPVLLAKGGGKGLKLYDAVLRDTHTSSVMQTRILAVTGREWEIVPPDGDDSPEMEEICSFLKKTFLSCNFDQARQELLKGIVYGFYVAEIMWKASESAWTIDKIMPKHPRRFSFTQERELRLLTPFNQIEGEEIPPRKFITFTYGNSDNPYGSGVGQVLWWPVWFKNNGIQYWMTFLDKYGLPTVTGQYPVGTDQEIQDKLLEALDAIQKESSIIFPENMKVALLDATRSGNASYQGLCDYMDNSISKAVLSQTLTTEVGKTGSYAASQTHNDVRKEVVKADSDCLCECLNGSIIPWLVDFNFGPQVEYPKIWIRLEDEKDLKPLADRDKILYDMGVPFPVSYFLETYSIPAPEGDEEVISNSTAGKAPGKQPQVAEATPQDKPAFAEKAPSDLSRLFPDQAALDDTQAPDLTTLDGILKPIVKLIKQGHSYEEVESRLTSTWPSMKPQELEEAMTRAIFMAETWGRLSADDN